MCGSAKSRLGPGSSFHRKEGNPVEFTYRGSRELQIWLFWLNLQKNEEENSHEQKTGLRSKQ